MLLLNPWIELKIIFRLIVFLFLALCRFCCLRCCCSDGCCCFCCCCRGHRRRRRRRRRRCCGCRRWSFAKDRFSFLFFFRLRVSRWPEILGTMHFRALWFSFADWRMALLLSISLTHSLRPFVRSSHVYCVRIFRIGTHFRPAERYVRRTCTKTNTHVLVHYCAEKRDTHIAVSGLCEKFRIVSPCLKLKIVDIFRTFSPQWVQLLPLLLLFFFFAIHICRH